MKMRLSLVVVSMAMAVSFLGCGSSRIQLDTNDRVETPGVIRVSAGWLKDKKKKFDVNLIVENLSKDEGIIVMLPEIKCGRGKVTGVLEHTFFNTGERTIDFKPGQVKTFNMVCSYGMAVEEGEYNVTISKVYENPDSDGHTVGKVLAKNVAWKVSP